MKKIIIDRLILSLAFLFILFLAPKQAFSVSSKTLEKVVLQLKWKHQFQFAGYYAAIEKGYYEKVGLKVILKEGRPLLNIADELVQGKANYAVSMPGILLEREKGKKVLVLAAIFQHSPEVLFVRKDSGITNPQDLIGKNVMLRINLSNEILAMFLQEGIKKSQVNILPHTWNINDLIDGKVDAASGYLTDRPFILKKLNVEFSIISPLTYGVDFYGDCLFTSEKEINNYPERVNKFLKASLKGWEYAMKYPEEISDLILKKYSRRLSKETLLYEAKIMRDLMQPDFIEIGHMNPGRWKHIADTFVKLGMLKSNYSLTSFLYNPKKNHYAKIMRVVWIMLFILIVITVAGIILFLFNRKLRKEVDIRTRDLEMERQFTEAILKTLPGIFYVYEEGKRLIRWNKNFQEESGLRDDEMAGRHPLDWFNGKEKEKIIKALQELSENGEVHQEANITFKNREVSYYLTGTILKTDNKTFLIGIGIDLTLRRQLEEQLWQAQKMESIGRLAGGVAHDFNNVLTIILGYTELLLTNMPETHIHWKNINIIHTAAEKASNLTRQLLAFSRKQILETKVISINIVVNDFLKILGKMLGEDIVIKTHMEAEVGIIEADVGQIEQVLMNLAVNARDAMPQGGDLIIETSDILFDTIYTQSHIDIKPGAYVMLSVTDTGEGMDKKIIEHIFDPFFTTKEKSKGTGLGLATVYGIVKQHDGQIYAYSEKNSGTTFKIYFPATRKTLDIDDDPNEIIPSRYGNETIMVVDDEPYVRKLILDTLSPLGYTCLEASCGKDAMKVIHNHTEKIHLLLTDVVMPRMSGRDLSEIILAENPDVKVLFMSGYTENVITHHGVLDSGVNYIAKPITPIMLTKKIRKVLDA